MTPEEERAAVVRAMNRWIAISCAALLGWFIGKALGVPVWRSWDIGDRFDIATTSAALVFCLTRHRHLSYGEPG